MSDSEIELHPVVLRLRNRADSTSVRDLPQVMREAAELIQAQHDAISEALDCYFDQDFQSMERTLMRVANESPYKQNAASKEGETP